MNIQHGLTQTLQIWSLSYLQAERSLSLVAPTTWTGPLTIFSSDMAYDFFEEKLPLSAVMHLY